MQAVAALAMLRYMAQAAAGPVAKTVASALANADEGFGLAREDMYITQITADSAPLRRWRRFGARGRFKPIIRRSAHITVVLEERE
jgi:large subunit ribosomal protein L22